MPVLNTDQMMDGGLTATFITDIVLTILSYVAEQERINIKQRQKEGIQSARRAGKKFGRPSKRSTDFDRIHASVQGGDLRVDEACRLLNISRKTYYNYQKSRLDSNGGI